MASLMRPMIVRYILTGRRVTKGTPGAKKVVQRARKWYGQDIPGINRRVPLAANKAAALQMLADLCRRGEQQQAGLNDQTAHRTTLIEKHIHDFRDSLDNGSNTAKYIGLTIGRITRALADCRVLADIDPVSVTQWLQRQRTDPDVKMSVQTACYYAQALSQFGAWLLVSNRWPANLLANLPKGNPNTDRRIIRRAFTPDEFGRLLTTTRNSSAFIMALTGHERYLLYRTAYFTGFRIAGLLSLTPESFALTSDPPTVTLATKSNKSRKLKMNAIPPDLANELQSHLRVCPPRTPVWGKIREVRAAKMLRVDLAAANIPVSIPGPDGPEVLDFHAIRHTAATELSRYDLRTAQEILGHSTPALTARYAHRSLKDQADALKKLQG